MRSTSRQSETGNTILFLNNFMYRTTRLFLSGLASVAAKRGWQVQHAIPPHGANAAYIRKLISFWHPVGIIAVYIGSIFNEVKHRPSYIIDEILNDSFHKDK